MLFAQGVNPMTEWIGLAVQAGGAIAVCAMFLWFLKQKQTADDKARKEFLNHLAMKDKSASEERKIDVDHMRERDSQSREIAMSGHNALREVATNLEKLRTEITNLAKPV